MYRTEQSNLSFCATVGAKRPGPLTLRTQRTKPAKVTTANENRAHMVTSEILVLWRLICSKLKTYYVTASDSGVCVCVCACSSSGIDL